MKHLLILTLIAAAILSHAAPMWFVLDDGDGTVSLEYEKSWNTPRDKKGQLAKLEKAPATPEGVESKWWSWDGTKVVESPQTVKDGIATAEAEIEAAETAAAMAKYEDDLATLGELLTDSGLDINDYETVKEVTEALHAKGLALRDAVAKAADYKAMQSAQVAYNAQLGRNSLLQIMFSQMSADASELVKLVKAAAVKETP